MASTSEAVRKHLTKWLRTRPRTLIAAFVVLVLVGVATIVATARSTSPTTADRVAPATTVEPTTEPSLVTAPSPSASTTSPPISAQSPVAVASGATTTIARRSPATTTKTTLPVGGPVDLAALPAGWVTLASAKGSTGARSPVFHLQDHNTRLRYTSSGTSLAVFVIDAQRGLDATAGYSDADCAGACTNGWMSLHDPAGDYYLLVQAGGGRWAVDISEYSGAVPN